MKLRSLARPPLMFCYAAQFLTVMVRGPGVGDPCSRTPAECPTIQLNSDTIYPEIAPDSPG